MKKNLIIFTIGSFLFLLLPLSVKALPICNSSQYNVLKAESYNLKITYDLIVDSKTEYPYYFELTFSNLTENIKISFNNRIYMYGQNKENPSTIKIDGNFSGGEKYAFQVYGSYTTGCIDEYIAEKNISLPVYNGYSVREECIGYEQFPLCKKWYSGDIKDEESFLTKLEEYKKSLEKEEDEEKEKTTESIFDKLIDFYIDNLVYTLSITILIVGGIIAIVIINSIKRKKRVKLDL